MDSEGSWRLIGKFWNKCLGNDSKAATVPGREETVVLVDGENSPSASLTALLLSPHYKDNFQVATATAETRTPRAYEGVYLIPDVSVASFF